MYIYGSIAGGFAPCLGMCLGGLAIAKTSLGECFAQYGAELFGTNRGSKEKIHRIFTAFSPLIGNVIGSTIGASLATRGIGPFFTSARFVAYTVSPLLVAYSTHQLCTRGIEQAIDIHDIDIGQEHRGPNVLCLNIPDIWVKVAGVFGMCITHLGVKHEYPLLGLTGGVLVSCVGACVGAMVELQWSRPN